MCQERDLTPWTGRAGQAARVRDSRVGGACQTLPATATTATFSSLARKTGYTFTVRATNSVGTGVAATVSVRTR